MKKTDITGGGARLKFDVRQFSGDPALARMVQERLSRVGPHGPQDVQRVLREARKLRQRLVQEATNSHRAWTDRTS
jgi:hypothetical protein